MRIKHSFISIEQNNNIDLESIYLFEDEMNEHIKEASQLKIEKLNPLIL